MLIELTLIVKQTLIEVEINVYLTLIEVKINVYLMAIEVKINVTKCNRSFNLNSPLFIPWNHRFIHKCCNYTTSV